MALLRYMKPVGGLSDPRGSLSSSMPTQAIGEANKEVQKAVGTTDEVNVVLTSGTALRAKIAKYACQHGAAATARYYSKKLEKPLNNSTVKSMKKLYAVNAQCGNFSCHLIFVGVLERRK